MLIKDKVEFNDSTVLTKILIIFIKLPNYLVKTTEESLKEA